MKKIILTGATSMLGISLIEECLRQGDEVAAVIRPQSKHAGRLLKFPGLRTVACDLSGIEKLPGLLGGSWDAFFHLGWGPTEKDGRDDPELQNANVGYTLEAVRSAKKLGCSFFLGAGSQAEYGQVGRAIAPDMCVAPEVAYGVAKYAAGKLSAILCKNLGVRHVWARIFSVYGAHDSAATVIMYCIEQLLKKKRPSLTRGEQIWDFLYCEDAARALYLLGEKGQDQTVYNVGSGDGRPLSEFVGMIRDVIDPALPVGFGDVPYRPGQIMHLCADISLLTQDTGFVPKVSFKEGIKRILGPLTKQFVS